METFTSCHIFKPFTSRDTSPITTGTHFLSQVHLANVTAVQTPWSTPSQPPSGTPLADISSWDHHYPRGHHRANCHSLYDVTVALCNRKKREKAEPFCSQTNVELLLNLEMKYMFVAIVPHYNKKKKGIMCNKIYK